MRMSAFIEREVHINGEELHMCVAVCHVEDEAELQSELEIDCEDQSDGLVHYEVDSYEVTAVLENEEPEDWDCLFVVCETRGDLLTPIRIFDDEEAAEEFAEEQGIEHSIECVVAQAPMTPVGITE